MSKARHAAKAPTARGARQVEALKLLVGEMQAAIRDLGGELALVRAQVAGLLEPAAVPDGYVALKAAAHFYRYGDEWLRQRCVRKEVDCMQIGGKGGRWFIRIDGTLAAPTPESGGMIRP